MKNVLCLLPLLVAFASYGQAPQKQLDPKVREMFMSLLRDINRIDINSSEQLKTIKPPAATTILTTTYDEVSNNIRLATAAIESKYAEYVADKSGKLLHLNTAIPALMSGVPEPVTDLPAAKKIRKLPYGEDPYTGYIENLKRQEEQLTAQVRNDYPKQDEEALKKKYAGDADKAMDGLANNPVVVAAGGIEKLKAMSPEQRAQLMKQMTRQVKQDPFVYARTDSDPAAAFTEKLTRDPAYAKRYQSMDNEKKQAAYKSFLKENGFDENASGKNPDAARKKREAETIIRLTKRTNEIYEHLRELGGIAAEAGTRVGSYFEEVDMSVGREYSRYWETLPLIDYGEAGKAKNTRPLDIAYNTVLYSVRTQHAVASTAIWKRHFEAVKIIISEFNDLIAANWGKDALTDSIMISQNLTPTALSAVICGQLIDLAKLAHQLTNQNGAWQQIYDETVRKVYD